MSKKWCIECKKELSGQDNSLSMFGITTSSGLYCNTTGCSRYGLITVIFLEEQTQAPENAKPNQPQDPPLQAREANV